MTLSELYSVQNDNAKLKSLYLELAQLEEFNPYKSGQVSDMPSGGGSGKSYAEWYTEEKERLEKDIGYWQRKIQDDRKKVNDFIDSAPHPDREIIRFRVINNLGWEDIGGALNIDRRTASRKFYRFLESCPQCPQDVW